MIRSEFEISDMVVKDLDWRNGILDILNEGDHLLRRFGEVEVVTIEPQGSVQVFRQQADEIWALLSGHASFHLQDRRQDSPSQGAEVNLDISQDSPQAVLIPFGVLSKVTSNQGATLVRINTHQDESFPGDEIP
jgi:mannose-6-phosphate isomerase-like protein (cupin superfamily)